ncbi:choline transporter-like 1 [Daktulosphaira vitifoliae]|uniref:choline transporter-like 1 n=1 Tax=Daktulosphaira vitifoliae TaxID=58002 RepID=UPI0021AAEED8|nr:choline transporter-like 1 [Daktulosphaira vitifoliae]XP_050535215.1 choline transporter-like 1 [Daktulosphaira vitifoliae]
MTCCGFDNDVPEEPGQPRIRGCTDIIWLFSYLFLWCLMILIAVFSIVYGDPLRLINGHDSFGNTCGSSSNTKMGELSGLDMTDKKFLYYLDPANIEHSLQICVKKCPDIDIINLRDLQIFYNRSDSLLCTYDFDVNNVSVTSQNKSFITTTLGPCSPFPIHKSNHVLNRCVPNELTNQTKSLIYNIYGILNDWDFSEEILNDLYKTWPQMFFFSLLTFILSFTIIVLIHILKDIIAHILMVSISILVFVTVVLLWWEYFTLKIHLDHTPEYQTLSVDACNEHTFFILAILFSLFSVVILLLVLAMRKRLNLLSTLFHESAECLSKLPALYWQPLCTFFVLLSLYACWIGVILHLATANYPGTKTLKLITDIPDQNVTSNSSIVPEALIKNLASIKAGLTAVEFKEATWVRYMWWVYVIGLIWSTEFILACQHMIIAGAVAKWYFTNGKTSDKSIILSSMCNLGFYHLGSVALGSLLIILFKIPRLILTLFSQKQHASSNSRFTKKTCFCCMYSFDNFFKYINHNAYAIVSMEGIGFCLAASRAWNVVVSNALRLSTINSIGDFILFLAKCIVTLIIGVIALLNLRSDPELHFHSIPIIIISIFSFFIAHCVISLYEVVIDTLFLCVCEDKNINGEMWHKSPIIKLSKPKRSIVKNTTVST